TTRYAPGSSDGSARRVRTPGRSSSSGQFLAFTSAAKRERSLYASTIELRTILIYHDACDGIRNAGILSTATRPAGRTSHTGLRRTGGPLRKLESPQSMDEPVPMCKAVRIET